VSCYKAQLVLRQVSFLHIFLVTVTFFNRPVSQDCLLIKFMLKNKNFLDFIAFFTLILFSSVQFVSLS